MYIAGNNPTADKMEKSLVFYFINIIGHLLHCTVVAHFPNVGLIKAFYSHLFI